MFWSKRRPKNLLCSFNGDLKISNDISVPEHDSFAYQYRQTMVSAFYFGDDDNIMI